MAKKRPIKKNNLKIRVYVASEYPIVRYGFSKLINSTSDMVVTGESDFSTLSKGVLSSKPDLIVVWIPEAEAAALIQELRSQDPNAKILCFSSQKEFPLAEFGTASGYLMKRENVEAVLQAMRRIYKEKIVVSAKNASWTVSSNEVIPSEERGIKDLTHRELEVFRFIGQGFNALKIAKELGLSVKTIHTFRERIKQKLGLKHANELVYSAVRWVQNK